MNNILNELPSSPLSARLRESMSFVADTDIQGKRILDIGCGFGWFEYGVLARGARRVDGIEVTEADLRTAKENLKDARVSFTVAGALDLPFPDNSFDTVVAWEVLEHIPRSSENQMFKEVARVLKTGGRFYLSTPYDSFLSKILDPAWWLIGHRHYSQEALTTYANGSGMNVLSMHRKGGIWSLLNTLNMYFSKWVLRRGPLFAVYGASREAAEYAAPEGYATIFVQYERV